MGCVNSRADINDLHPNIFQVMNVDDLGNLITPGRLEVTESEIVLYQRGRQAVKWPLRCLRRYGYDSEIFTFESGRRCSTGPGIYAFKCRRADQLFNLVQTNIQDCNNSGEDAISRDLTMPLHTGPTITRMTIPSEPNYLDPTPIRSNSRVSMSTRFPHSQQNGFGRLGSVGSSSGPISPQGTMGSPSPPPLSPMTLPPPPPPPATTTSQSLKLSMSHPPSQSALYVNEEVLSAITLELEHNNNKSRRRTMQRSYTMSSTTSSTGLISESIGVNQSTQECPRNRPPPLPSVSSYMNIDISSDASPLSPSHSMSISTPLKEDTCEIDTGNVSHAYMNINPGVDNVAESLQINSLTNRSRPPTLPALSTPTHLASQIENYPWDDRDARHCYENLEPGEIESLRMRISVNSDKFSLPPTTPSGEVTKEVNYAVLDLDKNNVSVTVTGDNASGSVALPSPPESPSKMGKGYATIDFNKTAALSHSVNPNGVNDNEGSRKTRHNSTINDLASPRQSSSISE
ncbi:fibroblast growth factor receptor substrate 2 [Diachasmimorpha longicaudata]|uniref:fibroblast growth factor receptor substrate 2 n=1 Tax=Diachasmimorpha longicaudata TaxID=58733 RepID=UPI0030B8C76C